MQYKIGNEKTAYIRSVLITTCTTYSSTIGNSTSEQLRYWYLGTPSLRCSASFADEAALERMETKARQKDEKHAAAAETLHAELMDQKLENARMHRDLQLKDADIAAQEKKIAALSEQTVDLLAKLAQTEADNSSLKSTNAQTTRDLATMAEERRLEHAEMARRREIEAKQREIAAIQAETRKAVLQEIEQMHKREQSTTRRTPPKRHHRYRDGDYSDDGSAHSGRSGYSGSGGHWYSY